MQFNLAQLHEAIAEAVPERDALITAERRFSYRELTERTRRLANFFLQKGLKVKAERSQLSNWESGQDHVALYLYNGNEYLEGMLGAFKARAVPFNVNYRYVEEELIYLLNNAQAKAIVYHSEFAPRIAAIRDQLPHLQVFLQVKDDSGNELLPGAIDYEEALASAPAEKPDLQYSPDDLYMLYTGGTTGMPKGVLWRHGDIIISALGGRRNDGSILENLEDFVARAEKSKGFRFLPTPPFMHGAGHWVAFNAWHGGNTVVLQKELKRLDPADVLTTVDQHKVNILLLVGDAFGRPLLDEMRRHQYDLSSIKNIMSSGAVLSQPVKQGLLECIPQVKIVDTMGSSETGTQGQQISTSDSGASSGSFKMSDDNVVLNEDMTDILSPGHEGLGWWAKKGYVPLGYLSDEAKTKKTFPEVNGTRYSVPGDRVRLTESGNVEFHGRDSVTINTGGEKVFAEEVEHALKHHPDVFDVVVAGRPSERWGNEVVAIVELRPGTEPNRECLLQECEQHIARYKLPKAFLFVEKIHRSPSGKADYRWAKEQAVNAD